jgi:hypothetical protein
MIGCYFALTINATMVATSWRIGDKLRQGEITVDELINYNLWRDIALVAMPLLVLMGLFAWAGIRRLIIGKEAAEAEDQKSMQRTASKPGKAGKAP